MRQLADFVSRMMVETPTKSRAARRGRQRRVRSGRAIGVIGIPGDRRDEDQREYGAIAAGAFDEIIVREDKNLRGRPAGESAGHVIEGIRTAQRRGCRPGGPVREGPRGDDRRPGGAPSGDPGRSGGLCVDDAIGVYREAMAAAGTSRGGTAFADPGELEAPEG